MTGQTHSSPAKRGRGTTRSLVEGATRALAPMPPPSRSARHLPRDAAEER